MEKVKGSEYFPNLALVHVNGIFQKKLHTHLCQYSFLWEVWSISWHSFFPFSSVSNLFALLPTPVVDNDKTAQTDLGPGYLPLPWVKHLLYSTTEQDNEELNKTITLIVGRLQNVVCLPLDHFGYLKRGSQIRRLDCCVWKVPIIVVGTRETVTP